MTTKFNSLFALLLCLLLTGCPKTFTIQTNMPLNKTQNVKQVVLFLDGTANDRNSRTNVSALSEIVIHQDKDNLVTFYNEGVGTSGKELGAATGWGIGKDVAEAYAFLTRYYSKDSKLYIFGFSRGAYTSRILAGMIFSVGIYDLSDQDEERRIEISKELYSAYKGKKNIDDIKISSKKVITRWADKLERIANLDENVTIEAMGLWDTVEALGLVPTKEAFEREVFKKQDPQNIVDPNDHYIDQICNVKHVYHALSLDDNRAYVFTPILITSNYTMTLCKENKDKLLDRVKEVWFSGAHADIGGGYTLNENNKKGVIVDRDLSISGVSLNWMMSKLKDDCPDLLPKTAKVFENKFAYVHDAENHNPLYGRESRNEILEKYPLFSEYKKIHIHKSAFERIKVPNKGSETYGYDSEWYKSKIIKECFDNNLNFDEVKCNNIVVLEK